MKKYGHMLECIAVSCDSFEPETLREIGAVFPKCARPVSAALISLVDSSSSAG